MADVTNNSTTALKDGIGQQRRDEAGNHLLIGTDISSLVPCFTIVIMSTHVQIYMTDMVNLHISQEVAGYLLTI